MIEGIVDTNIIVEVYRRKPGASEWLRKQTDLAITTINWLEVMEGAPGKAGQAASLAVLNPFPLVALTDADQRWAMRQMQQYRLSRGVAIKDTLIASVVYRLQVPIYTHNVKDFIKLLDKSLVIKPY